MVTLSPIHSSPNAARPSSATRRSWLALDALCELNAKITRTARVLITESGPENTPSERPLKSDWICLDPPGPTEVPETAPDPVLFVVGRSNWRDFEGYNGPPTKRNYRAVGALLIQRGVPVGIVSGVEILEDFRTGRVEHRYQVQVKGEVRSGT